MPTQDKQSSHIRSAGQINSLPYRLTKPHNSRIHQLINSPTHQLKAQNTETYKLKNSQVQQLTNSKSHQPKSHQPKISSTQKLKLLPFILQCRSNFRSVLAKI